MCVRLKAEALSGVPVPSFTKVALSVSNLGGNATAHRADIKPSGKLYQLKPSVKKWMWSLNSTISERPHTVKNTGMFYNFPKTKNNAFLDFFV
jgi:hypothetical protein